MIALMGNAAAQAQAEGGMGALTRIREAALAYSDRLQDFTCIQITKRSNGPALDGPHWKPLETQEVELNYVDHHEHYKLLKIDGTTNDLEKRNKTGYFRGYGQFGSALLDIFDPKTNARFEWDHSESGPAGNICVYRYEVPQADSRISILADKDKVKLGHHGKVWASCENGAVLRFVTETDLGEVRRMGRRVSLGYRLDVRYGPVTIGSAQFILPQSAIQTGLFYKTWTKSEIEFREYRKYDASSVIKFGEGEARPDRK